MNEKEIIRLYEEENLTLREVAIKLNTNHKLIGRILRRNGITITKRNKLRVFTDEHKKNISDSRKRLSDSGYVPYNKGLKTITRICKNGKTGEYLMYQNMKSHLRHDIDLDWLRSFSDFEKLKFLNRAISRRRDFGDYTKDFYTNFIEKFYSDKQFNTVYETWINDMSDILLRPSPDHIIPKKHGMFDIENIRFITWFENRCKNNIDLDKWELIKTNINKYFV